MIGRRLATRVWLPLLLLTMWEAASRTKVLDPLFFPPPSTILPSAHYYWTHGDLPRHLGATFHRLGLGLAIGGGLGLLVGVLLGSVVFLRRSVEPLLVGIYSLPKISLLPLMILLLGIGETPRLLLVVLAAFLTMTLQVADAVRGIPALYLDVARSCGASSWLIFRRVYLPATLPQAFTGLRLAVGRALLAVISVELISCQEGIGSMIFMAWQTFAVDKLYVGITAVSAIGITSTALLRYAEAKFAPWQASQSGVER